MNTLDVLVLITTIAAFYRGWTKGVVSAILSLVAVLISGTLSFKLSQTLADYLLQNKILESEYILPISFVITFIGIILLFRLLIKAVEGILKLAMLGWVNKLIGGLLYAFIGVFIISALFWLANFTHVITPESKTYSKTYSFVQPVAPHTVDVIAKVLPMCSDVVEKIRAHYNKI